ncbi:protein kinase, partial [Myxococcota bacterium]|nr:protein kinase [Myxococcota bacterium]
MKYPVPFGRHLLLERINVGGMAEVFKAKSFGVEGFERIVAVKRILPTMAEDDEFVTMFVDEARIASHLTHQNIVQIYELGRFGGGYYISMEYVAGRDLRQLLDQHKRIKRPMEVGKACYIVSRVCEALDYAHRKKDPAGKDLKIIHRDVSPQNVIISFEGEVKLCDFGIAKAATRASRTQVGVLKGKFAYMSPEQVRGQAVDRRSDIFALGVIFYEMLTGERLFLGESDYSTLEAVRSARVPPPTQFNDKIPAGLEKIMMKLLAREPKDRYQWASEVHEDLLDHLVVDGKIYHGRHLRTWMQETYAREIEIENAKLEDFMKLKLPEPREPSESPPPPASPVVVAMAAQTDKKAPIDPTFGVPTFVAPPASDLAEGADPTNEMAALRPSKKGRAEPVTPSAPGDAARVDGPRSAGTSPVPQHGSVSPVSSLYGAPSLDASDDDDIVRPAQAGDRPAFADVPIADTFVPPRAMDVPFDGGGLSFANGNENATLMVDEEADGELERTQWDVVALDGQGNVTHFDPERDPDARTLTSEALEAGLEAEIRATQAELIDQLDAQGALDAGETIDAAGDTGEVAEPLVFDPNDAPAGTTSRGAAQRPGGGSMRAAPQAPSLSLGDALREPKATTIPSKGGGSAKR